MTELTDQAKISGSKTIAREKNIFVDFLFMSINTSKLKENSIRHNVI